MVLEQIRTVPKEYIRSVSYNYAFLERKDIYPELFFLDRLNLDALHKEITADVFSGAISWMLHQKHSESLEAKMRVISESVNIVPEDMWDKKNIYGFIKQTNKNGQLFNSVYLRAPGKEVSFQKFLRSLVNQLLQASSTVDFSDPGLIEVNKYEHIFNFLTMRFFLDFNDHLLFGDDEEKESILMLNKYFRNTVPSIFEKLFP